MVRLFIVQLVLAVLVGAGYYFTKGQDAAIAALFGGLIALTNGLLLSWRSYRAEQATDMSAHQSLRVIYTSALERFAAVAGLFYLGMGPLQLVPLPLLVGFIVGMVALFYFGKPTSG